MIESLTNYNMSDDDNYDPSEEFEQCMIDNDFDKFKEIIQNVKKDMEKYKDKYGELSFSEYLNPELLFIYGTRKHMEYLEHDGILHKWILKDWYCTDALLPWMYSCLTFRSAYPTYWLFSNTGWDTSWMGFDFGDKFQFNHETDNLNLDMLEYAIDMSDEFEITKSMIENIFGPALKKVDNPYRLKKLMVNLLDNGNDEDNQLWNLFKSYY